MADHLNNPFLAAQPVTLTQHILSEQQAAEGATGDLTILLSAIETAVKFISSRVGAAGIYQLYGKDGSTNVQGEEVKKLDVLSNDAFVTALRRSRKVSTMVSEENDEPILVDGAAGRYACVFDPLDGSSNIDANVSIGTIFGIYKASASPSVADALQPGSRLVAAGYAMYGSATLLVLSVGRGVSGFTLDRTIGEFVLTQERIRVPDRGSIYSVNEGNSRFWGPETRAYVEALKAAPKPYSLRYIGSMVADVHRTLQYGGIFAYPADSRAPSGKLRLLYEANPMAFLVEQAGGAATTGTARILDLQPAHIHERTPIYLGSTLDVQDLQAHFGKPA